MKLTASLPPKNKWDLKVNFLLGYPLFSKANALLVFRVGVFLCIFERCHFFCTTVFRLSEPSSSIEVYDLEEWEAPRW